MLKVHLGQVVSMQKVTRKQEAQLNCYLFHILLQQKVSKEGPFYGRKTFKLKISQKPEFIIFDDKF